MGLGWGTTTTLRDSNSIYIREKVDDLLRMDLPPPLFDMSSNAGSSGLNALGRSQQQQRLEFASPDSQVPLIRGFMATTPSARGAREARRRKRAGLGELALGIEGGKLGLKERGNQARGLLGAEDDDTVSELGINRRTSGVKTPRKRKGRRSDALGGPAGSLRRKPSSNGLGVVEEEGLPELTLPELQEDAQAVEQDMTNVAVRRVSISLAFQNPDPC